MHLSLLLLGRELSRLLFRQTPAHRTRLLRAKVEREVLFSLVVETQLMALVGVDDSEDSSDAFAQIVTR